MVQPSSPTNTHGGNKIPLGHEKQGHSLHPRAPWLSHLVTAPAGSSKHTLGRPPNRLPQGGLSVYRGVSVSSPGHRGMLSCVCLQTHTCTCLQYSHTTAQQTLLWPSVPWET